MTPEGGIGFESIVGQKSPAVLGNQVHRLDDVLELVFVDEVVEVDPDPAGLDHLATLADLHFDEIAGVGIDPEQTMTVGPGTRAPAAGLDAEEIVEKRDDVVVVQEPLTEPNNERDDRQTSSARGCRES